MAFQTFIQNLYDSSIRYDARNRYLLQEHKSKVEKTFGEFLANEPFSADGSDAFMDVLRKDYDYLGEAGQGTEPVNPVVSDLICSDSFGWKLQYPDQSYFLRLSRTDKFVSPMDKQKGKAVEFHGRPDLVAGVGLVHETPTEHSIIDVCTFMQPLESVPAFKNREMHKHLVYFNGALIESAGFESFSYMSASKGKDFGILFFDEKTLEEQKGLDCNKIVYNGSECLTGDGQKVVPVVYLFDTDSLKEKISLDDQAAHYQKLLDQDRLMDKTFTETPVGRIDLTNEFKRNILACYLAHDQKNRIQKPVQFS